MEQSEHRKNVEKIKTNVGILGKKDEHVGN
jgi:hypothetical protein